MLYQCPTCSWTGEATSATNYYAKEHVKIVEEPYVCKICLLVTGYWNRFERHLKHRQHEKKIVELGDDPHNIIREPAGNFQYLFRLVKNSEKKEEKIKKKTKEKEGEQIVEKEKLKERERDREAKELEKEKLRERERDRKAKELEKEKLKEQEI